MKTIIKTGMFIACMILALFMDIQVSAEEKTPLVEIPEEVLVNQETGEFEFEIKVNSEDEFAGLEFGVICGKGCEVTGVSYNVEANSIGPTEAQGVTWFGFFEGSDLFLGEVIITVSGKCEQGIDSAISFQDMKSYTVGDSEYTQNYVAVNKIVNLCKNEVEVVEAEKDTTPLAAPATDKGVSTTWQNVIYIIVAMLAVGVLIYILWKKKEEKKHEKEIR